MTYLERWIPTFVAGFLLMVAGFALMIVNHREDKRRRSESAQPTPHKETGA